MAKVEYMIASGSSKSSALTATDGIVTATAP